MPGLSDIPFVGKVEEEISSATIEGLKREFLYMYKYKDNVNALQAKMVELGVQEEKIKRKVEIDTDDGKTIEDHVLKWQQDVQQIKVEVEEFLRMYESKISWRCLKVLRFPNLYSRFRTGREALKKTEKVKGLTVPGKELVDGEISYFRHVGYADLPSTTSFDSDYLSFESRKDAYKKILEALNNKDAGFVVGIYGMAGAGKTRMMEQAWKQAKKDGIFDEVARADVSSENLNVRELQEQLASCLNLHLPPEKNEEMRASQLVDRLTKKGNKILVLFDDVWEELPLNKIGVPFGDGRSKGCKILLTSRKRDVCLKNNCEDPIEIKLLKEEEGWDLFYKNVGSSTINSLNDKSLAKNVCNECACLPLVIAAVGKALKGKPEHDSWKDALGQLQNSKLEQIDGIDPKVHAGLVLSFNHLPKDAKSCLFLCSVFPEDATISIEELVRLVKGNNLIEDLGTLENSRDRVRSMVLALKNSSLLLPHDDDINVKLHDIIRDVAKSVAAEDSTYAFLEKSCGTEWPDVDRFKDRKLISLSFDNINYFPPVDDLDCPELHTLVLNLETDWEDQQFSDRFFDRCPKLKVLVLNGWSISHLSSSSLQSLTNLRMLSLYCANLNMSLIKELKNLEMLIILDDYIEELSLELRELKRLRLLDMSRNYRRHMIMPRLLSSLSNLEELYIPSGFSPQGKEEGGGGDANPIHHELSQLTNLTTLHILLPDVMFLPNKKICQKLLRYVIQIAIDEPSERFYPKDEKRVLRLSKVVMQGRSSSLEILLESVEYMRLESMNGFQTYFNNSNHGKSFANLTYLYIRECDDLEHLARLPQNYQQFPHHQPMIMSFSKLTELEIRSSRFKYLFCPSSARRLVQLQKLLVDGCRMMEEIIRPREHEEEEEIIEFPNLREMELWDLSRLKSFYCKKINMRSTTLDQNPSTFLVHRLFNGMVSFPVLKVLSISSIENVTKIWEPQCHTKNSFSQLNILEVWGCDKLENVIPFAMLQRLQNMETLNVQDCSSLKCIVNGAKSTTTKDQEDSYSEIVFPVLKTLELLAVPKLDNFWCTRSMGSNIDRHQPSLLQRVSFPVLKKLCISSIKNVIEIWEPQCHTKNSFSQLNMLYVGQCDKLENVIPFAMLQRLQNMETLMVQRCSSLKCIVNGAKSATAKDQEDSDSEIVFPVLKTLKLSTVPKLDNFWCARSVGSNIDQHQPSLLQKVSFPVLKELSISSIENVIEIWDPKCHTKNSFSQLNILDVSDCNKLENVIPFAMLQRLQNMETLQVQNCSSLKCIVNGAKSATAKDQEDSDSEIIFPVLKTLELSTLPKLDNFWCTRSMGTNTGKRSRRLHKVSFPKLEKLELAGISSDASDLVDLMGLNSNLPRDHEIHDLLCFRGLKMLFVINCNLSNLFTCSLAKTNLQRLEVLRVTSGKKMEEIVTDENEGNKKIIATGTNAHDDEILIVFPRLKIIRLEALPVLKSFCGSARYTFNMPSLEEVVLRNCPLMTNFTCGQLTTAPKFRIIDNDWNVTECTDLNKHLQTLLRSEGESESTNKSDGNQDNTEDDA